MEALVAKELAVGTPGLGDAVGDEVEAVFPAEMTEQRSWMSRQPSTSAIALIASRSPWRDAATASSGWSRSLVQASFSCATRARAVAAAPVIMERSSHSNVPTSNGAQWHFLASDRYFQPVISRIFAATTGASFA